MLFSFFRPILNKVERAGMGAFAENWAARCGKRAYKYLTLGAGGRRQ